jgi:hypothetical protein
MSSPNHVVPAWHSSFARKVPGETRPPAPVVFPSSGTVTLIFAVDFPSGQHGYQIRYSPCGDVIAYFNHLGAVSDKLLSAVAASPGNCRDVGDGIRSCQHATSVQVQMGEAIGMSDDTAGVDFGLIDYRMPPAAFVNPSHYTRDFFYYASPVGYFTPALRSVMESRLASYDGRVPRTAEPRGGTYMQDLAGTAQGNWFTPGQNFATVPPSEDTMIALARDYIAPEQPVFSFGQRNSPLKAGIFSFPVEAAGRVNRDFSAVTADGLIYCYDRFLGGQTRGGIPLSQPGGIILVSLSSATTLRVEIQGTRSECGATASWSFASAARDFER